MTYNRRKFIKTVSLFSVALSISGTALASSLESNKLKVGIISDLHYDLIHDGADRMDLFLNYMKGKKVDALFQLGDFAYPKDKNKHIIEKFNNAHEKSYHVIGNHDTESGCTKQNCLDIWGMPSIYYTKVLKGIRFIFLDGNDKGSPFRKRGYASYIGKQQKIWLDDQLEKSKEPVVVISHQPIAGKLAIDNQKEIQELLSNHSKKILLCLNGHSHIDSLLEIEGVKYLHINSASYFWVGGKYKHLSFSKQIHKKHRSLAYMCPYKESIFAMLTIDLSSNRIVITGKKSQWVGSSPKELGFPTSGNEEIVPFIRSRNL